MKTRKRRRIVGYSFVLVVIVGSILLIVPIYQIPQRESVTIVSSQNQFQMESFNATTISASLKPQGFIGALYSLHYVPANVSVLPSALIFQSSSLVNDSLNVSFYSNNSFSIPTRTYHGTDLNFFMVSQNTSEPFDRFYADYASGTVTDSSDISGTEVGGAFNPPSSIRFGYALDAFSSSFTDFVNTSKGAFTIGYFTLDLTGGYSGYRFNLGLNLSVNEPLVWLDGKPINVTSPYVEISGYESLRLFTNGAGNFRIPMDAISQVTLDSTHPPYSSLTLSSNMTKIYGGGIGQVSVSGITKVSPVGEMTMSIYQEGGGYYIAVNSPDSLVWHEGHYVYTTSGYLLSPPLRVVTGLFLGSFVSMVSAYPLRKFFNWMK